MESVVMREIAARNLVARLPHAVDLRRWADARALFADEVTVDYTSLFGGDVQRLGADALIASWERQLTPLDATQHLTGAIVVRLEGAHAVAECHVRAEHIRRGAPDGDQWVVAGQWAIEMIEQPDGWRISAITLRTLYQNGNRQLLAQAVR